MEWEEQTLNHKSCEKDLEKLLVKQEVALTGTVVANGFTNPINATVMNYINRLSFTL